MTPQTVAEAQLKDLSIQDKYDCDFMTHWNDEEPRSTFCLVKEPSIAKVHQAHNDAHGAIIHEIIEVNSNIV